MNKVIGQQQNKTFETIKNIDKNGNEFWYARILAKTLDYSDFRNFLKVIDKAKIACEASGNKVLDHIVKVNEMVQIGSDPTREISSFALSRYACYLIVQNAGSSKSIIANGQTYFAIQTRRKELEDSTRLPSSHGLRGNSYRNALRSHAEHGNEDKFKGVQVCQQLAHFTVLSFACFLTNMPHRIFMRNMASTRQVSISSHWN